MRKPRLKIESIFQGSRLGRPGRRTHQEVWVATSRTHLYNYSQEDESGCRLTSGSIHDPRWGKGVGARGSDSAECWKGVPRTMTPRVMTSAAAGQWPCNISPLLTMPCHTKRKTHHLTQRTFARHFQICTPPTKPACSEGPLASTDSTIYYTTSKEAPSSIAPPKGHTQKHQKHVHPHTPTTPSQWLHSLGLVRPVPPRGFARCVRSTVGARRLRRCASSVASPAMVIAVRVLSSVPRRSWTDEWVEDHAQ